MEKWQQFFGKGWADQLAPYLESEEFNKIGAKLRELNNTHKTVIPKNRDMFKAFYECPWERLHTVILATAPYVGKDDNGVVLADGLAFSARNSVGIPKQLETIFDAIDSEVYNYGGFHLGESNDLTNWANSGILLLNCTLTYELHNSLVCHIPIWNNFIRHIIQQINSYKDDVGFILMGNYARVHKSLITNPSFAVYECEHPSEAAYRNNKWNSNNVFKALTAYHKAINNVNLIW